MTDDDDFPRCSSCGRYLTPVRGYTGEADHYEYVCRNPRHDRTTIHKRTTEGEEA